MKRRFHQLDVFSAHALCGNPLAVVHDASGLDDAQMAAFARWTNLSETTFLLPPTDAGADYHVRIFTPGGELPFAGHPTLGSCHAWLLAGGVPREAGVVVQQCQVGLVRVKRDGARLAFAAPPLRRSGPLDAATVAQIQHALALPAQAVRAGQWVDNGPGWCALLLDSAARVLAVKPDWPALGDLKLGLVGPHPAGGEAQFEVRALIGDGAYEDPVTGSLNASIAQWLIGAGIAPARYVAAQGAALQRAGRVHIDADGDTVWVGGDVSVCIEGEVSV
ncbi:MAG: PhzF family phenazine biosynthesis protein [Rubrivivax sp.]